MPLLLAGLRKNTSLFRFHVARLLCFFRVPPTTEETARCADGWLQEWNVWGTRRFRPLIRVRLKRASASWCLASCACPRINLLMPF
jgi:hypothetical protein